MTDPRALSKFLSYVLRHHPEAIGIALASDGSVNVDTLLDALNRHGRPIDRAQLEHLVATSDEQRFAFNADHSKIRANQGHSVEVDLGLSPASPPELLFHGTVERFLSSIRAGGLVKGERHHVHLSASPELATLVGSRRGQAIVLDIAAERMAAAGYPFYRSDNGVWLTERVPPEFIGFPRAD